MPGQPITTTAQSGILALGVDATFKDAYKRGMESAMNGVLGQIVGETSATADVVKYAYLESAPLPVRWDAGRGMPSKAMKDVGWSVTIDRWAAEVKWRFEDAQDQQIAGAIQAQAMQVGEGFWVRDEANIFEIINASVTAGGLSAAPNAADGVALFSATDATGAGRFGATGGNTITGASFNSGAGVRAAFFSAVQRRGAFLDTESQPLFGGPGKRWLVFGAVADTQVLYEGFYQQMTAQASTISQSNAGVSNVIRDAGLTVDLRITPRLSTGKMICFDLDVPIKPFIRANRMAPEPMSLTRANNLDAQNYGLEGIQWVSRTGYGVALPYGCIKVST